MSLVKLTNNDEIFITKLEPSSAEKDCVDSPLCCKKFAVSDNICTKNVLTTCGSKILENFIPPYDATVIGKVKTDGAVIIGKTSLDEFGIGGCDASAEAVAESFCDYALAGDAGGSLRRAASKYSLCGIRPTYGRVSRFGLAQFASSFDQVGAIAETPRGCAEVLNTISGFDINDGMSSKRSVPDFSASLDGGVSGLKIAIPKEFFGENVDVDVKEAVLRTAEEYKKMGADLIDVSIPSLKYAAQTFYIISCAEVSSNMSRYDGIKFGHRSSDGDDYSSLVTNSRTEGFGNEVKRRILLGNYFLSSGQYDVYFKKAMALKQLIRDEFAEIFEYADIILAPTISRVAYKNNENELEDVNAVAVDIAGLPAITIPTKSGSPIGMQLIGKHWGEEAILKAANAYFNNERQDV